MTTQAPPRFYVYVLCRPNGKPFYVGKGSGRRMYQHESEALTGHRCHKCNIIRKILRQGGKVLRYTVLATDDEQAAFECERKFIELHGRENLANLTDGGEGMSGYETPIQLRQARSKARKTNWQDPNYRDKMTRMSQEIASSPEWRASLSQISKDRLSSPVEREKLSQAQYKRWSNAEQSERDRVVNWNNERWARPGEKEKLAERNKSDESRKKLSETRKAQWADPEYRAKMLAANKKRKRTS